MVAGFMIQLDVLDPCLTAASCDVRSVSLMSVVRRLPTMGGLGRKFLHKLHDMDILRNLESTFILWIQIDIYFLASTSYHHRFTLFVEGDREEVLPVKPSLRALYLLQLFTVNVTGGYQSRGLISTLKNFLEIALNRFDNPFNSWGTELYEGHTEERMNAVRWAGRFGTLVEFVKPRVAPSR